MKSKYNEIDECFDILFNQDLCSICYHEPNCILLNMIESGIVEIVDTNPIQYCNFFLQTEIGEGLNWFTKITYKLQSIYYRLVSFMQKVKKIR